MRGSMQPRIQSCMFMLVSALEVLERYYNTTTMHHQCFTYHSAHFGATPHVQLPVGTAGDQSVPQRTGRTLRLHLGRAVKHAFGLVQDFAVQFCRGHEVNQRRGQNNHIDQSHQSKQSHQSYQSHQSKQAHQSHQKKEEASVDHTRAIAVKHKQTQHLNTQAQCHTQQKTPACSDHEKCNHQRVTHHTNRSLIDHAPQKYTRSVPPVNKS